MLSRGTFLAANLATVAAGTALPRPGIRLKSLGSPIDYNVIDYGADPSGMADSTTAFNNAISAAYAAGGGRVYAPGGSYLILSNVNPASGVIIQGYGATLLGQGGVGHNVFSFANLGQGRPGLQNAMIVGFTINLRNTGTTAISITAQNNSDLVFRDLTIENAIASVPGPLFIVGNVDNTSFPNNHSERIHVDHCTFVNSSIGTYEALDLVSCDESSVTNCKFFNVSTASSPLGIYGYCNGVVLSGNTFRACAGAILLQGGQNIIVQGNAMRNGSNVNDLTVRNCQSVQIIGNNFAGQTTSNAIQLDDLTGMDAHPLQFASSSIVMIGSNMITSYNAGVIVQPTGPGTTAAQTQVSITNNVFAGVTTPLSSPSSVTPLFNNNP